MPLIKSAKKQLKKSIKARKKNVMQKEEAKKVIKDFDKLIKTKKTDEAQKKMAQAYSKIDRLKKNNLIHKNKAARKKAQIMKKLNAANKTK